MNKNNGNTIGKVTGLNDKFIEEAAAWYAQKGNDIPAPFRKVDKRILRRVSQIAKGDWHRCVIEDNGAVTVHNKPMWVRTPSKKG
jgi:hypothetical protein